MIPDVFNLQELWILSIFGLHMFDFAVALVNSQRGSMGLLDVLVMKCLVDLDLKFKSRMKPALL